MHITGPHNSNTNQRTGLDYCHYPQIDFCCLGFLDLSNRILIPSSFITRSLEISIEYLWLFYYCVLLPHRFLYHTYSHTQTYISECFLILWQIQYNLLVLHNWQRNGHMFWHTTNIRTALWCDILLIRKKLECFVLAFQQQFLLWYYFNKSFSCFPLFLGRHTHNKTLFCRTIGGWEDFGHYIAEEYKLGLICILYISLMLFFVQKTAMNRSVFLWE